MHCALLDEYDSILGFLKSECPRLPPLQDIPKSAATVQDIGRAISEAIVQVGGTMQSMGTLSSEIHRRQRAHQPLSTIPSLENEQPSTTGFIFKSKHQGFPFSNWRIEKVTLS